MVYITAIVIIVLLLLLKKYIWKSSDRKSKKYLAVINTIGAIIIIAMAVVYIMNVQKTRKDSSKYRIINGTALSDIVYEGQKDGYYIISESGLLYFDCLLVSVNKVQLSDMCFPGSQVRLYCNKDKNIYYNDENKITLSDGVSGYYTDAVIMINPDFRVLSICVIFIDIALMVFNDIVFLVVVLTKKR
ncbi:MAG: hypothetical protein E7505_02680 [Ruminococcus sp.]|nr:hypothetical protein [Ruminococcus sp.]